MGIYTFLSWGCIAVLAAGAFHVLKNLLSSDRHKRVEFVRTFKNGRFVLILIPTFLIVLMGLFYVNGRFIDSFLRSFPICGKLVVMNFELDKIQSLMDDNAVYRLAVYIDCFLILSNICMVSASLFKQILHSKRMNRKFLRTKKNMVVIIGSSKESMDVYDTAPSSSCRFISGQLKKEDMDTMYNDGVEYLTLPDNRILDRVCSLLTDDDNPGQVCSLFINTRDDSKNFALARDIISRIEKLKEDELKKAKPEEDKPQKDDQEKGTSEKRRSESALKYEKLSVYIFGSSKRKDLYLELEEKGFGCFHYVDEYRLAVLDLIDKHPMASFFTASHVDTKNCVVRNDVNLKVFLIGFGKSNTELFLQSVSNDQFVILDGEGRPVHKAVEYYIFDRKTILENSNLNYNYNRYAAFLKLIQDNEKADEYYQPFAPVPAVEHLEPTHDIDCKTFFLKLGESLGRGKNDLNFISVSLGKDIESVDLANKIVSKCREWEVAGNTLVCVRIRDRNVAEKIADEGVLLWGDLRKTVFDYTAITRKNLEELAMIHDGVYGKYKTLDKASVSEDLNRDDVDLKKLKNRRSWYEHNNRMKRESNINVFLNLRTKLCLMGVDTSSYETLEDILYKLPYSRLEEVISSLSPSANENLARQEHYRWNAHYISNGFVPADREESVECLPNDTRSVETAKDNKEALLKLRKHPALLEYDALDDNYKGLDNLPLDELRKIFKTFQRV